MSARAKSRSPVLRERPPIEWRPLCAIAIRTLGDVETFADWKGTIVDRVIAQGFRVAHPAQLDRAMQACETSARKRRDPRGAWLWTPESAPLAPAVTPHVDPTIQRRPATPDPATWTSIDRLAHPTSNACGASKRGSGMRPLRCTRPEGHDGDHGMSAKAGGVIFVRWARETGDAR
jgi:hypothetical protein